MNKILTSLLMIGVVAAMVGAGTWAYFSDTETSVSNSFAAGTLDLKLTGGTAAGDGVIDTWTTPTDWAPGLTATGTLTMDNVGTINMTKVKMTVAVTDSGVSINEPECVAEGGTWTPSTCTGNTAKDDISTKIDVTTLTYNAVDILPALVTARGDKVAPLLLSELNGLSGYDLISAASTSVLPGDGSGVTTHPLVMTVTLQTGTLNEYQSDKSAITLTIVGEQ